jgi:hypothetical protein
MPRRNINARPADRLRRLPRSQDREFIALATSKLREPLSWTVGAIAALQEGNERAAELRLRCALELLCPTPSGE